MAIGDEQLHAVPATIADLLRTALPTATCRPWPPPCSTHERSRYRHGSPRLCSFTIHLIRAGPLSLGRGFVDALDGVVGMPPTACAASDVPQRAKGDHCRRTVTARALRQAGGVSSAAGTGRIQTLRKPSSFMPRGRGSSDPLKACLQHVLTGHPPAWLTRGGDALARHATRSVAQHATHLQRRQNPSASRQM